jgi:hypothetical protein
MTRRTLLSNTPGALLAAAAPRVQELTTPSGPESGHYHLAALPDGSASLSWLEMKPERALVWSSFDGRSWSQPQTIVKDHNLLLNWADFPTVCPLSDGRMAAHWLMRHPVQKFVTSLRIGHSADAGRTWRTVFAAGESLTDDYSGFVSLVRRKTGFSAVYLAPPEGKREQHGGHEGFRKTLRFANFDLQGQRLADEEIDADVCSCCQTAVAETADGPMVAYRDHETEIRDISVVRRTARGWSEPRPLHRDGWRINACPVNGPALASAGGRVAAVWYTGAQDQPRVQVAFSNDAGQSFGRPVRVDGGAPVGRVSVALLPDETAVAGWIEKLGDGTVGRVRLRRVSADGTAGRPLDVAEVSTARTTGFPRLLLWRGQLLVAWRTDRVRTGLVPLPEIKS